MASVGAVIVAAGAGVRMGGADKLFTRIGGRSLLAHAVAAFDECASVDRIVLVASPQNIAEMRAMLTAESFAKVAGVCTGGARRQDSVFCGLKQLGPCDWVAVHDGGRPLLKHALITRGLRAAAETGAAVPVIPLADTVKEIAADGTIVRTLDRESLRGVQTPQVFRYDLLLRAHQQVSEDVTDDAAMLERLGVAVRTFEGDPRNIKITTAQDLLLAEAYLQ